MLELPNPPCAATPTKVVIDTDPGVDDAMALILALASPELDVVGVTIVMGNSPDTRLLAVNAAKIMALCGVHDVPVYIGASHPLANPYDGHQGVHVHNENGVGGAAIPVDSHIEPTDPAITSANDYLLEVTQGGDVAIIALGPLTNIATAVTSDSEFAARVPLLSFMGGSIDGVGNATPAGEANFVNDPEAAAAVLAAPFPCMVMAGLNVTRKVPLAEPFRDALRSLDTPVTDFIFASTAGYIAALAEWGFPSYVHDSTAVMPLIAPALFDAVHVAVRVETKGELTRGASVVDYTGHHWPDSTPNVFVLTTVDTQAYYDVYVERIAALQVEVQ